MRVPLVLLTGFLGAGKTTLVNQLLGNRARRAASGKLGVIVNELGEVGIDGALLAGEATRQVELPGGCVCCVLGTTLDQTLLELVDRNPDLQAIVLETTGVAEPLPIAWALRREPVQQRVRLAAVVTLVDAANFRASRAVSASVSSQVAYADVLLVTKEELAGDAEARAAVSAACALAPRALVRHGSTADHAAWLEQTLADPVIESPQAAHPTDEGEATIDHRGHVHVDGECREPAARGHGVDSIWLELDAPVDVEELEDQLAELPPGYVRIKGIVRGSDGAWTVLHRVGVRVSTEPLESRADGRLGLHGRIVALGSELSRDELRRCLVASYAA